jgi:hypothetical protein
MKPISRRTLLQGASAVLPLPLLEAMTPRVAMAADKVVPAKRLLIIHSFLGFHTPEFIPKKPGQLVKSTAVRQRRVQPLFCGFSDMRQENGAVANCIG